MRSLRSKLGFLLLMCVTASACFAQPAPATGAADSLFDFHSEFWINLHHFLYRQAILDAPGKGPLPSPLTQSDLAQLQQLSPEERAKWETAVSYYKTSMVDRDLLFDQEMCAIKNTLEDADSSPDLANIQMSAELKQALLTAAPIYKKYWWTEHNTQNQQWVNQVKPLVKEFGPGISEALIRIYDSPWPQYPVRVDVVAYANWTGAYTTLEPTRSTISSTNPANQGTAALEVIFHETSHGMMDKVMDAFRVAEANVNAHGGKYHTGSLWHAVLFYTAGELVAERVPGYVPYAEKNGLWTRVWTGPARSLIERDWQPHMNGHLTLSAAITSLVADIASTPPHP